MSVAVVPYQGMLHFLRSLLDHPESLVLRLYGNDHTPGSADRLEDYDELVGNGYEPVVLGFERWRISPGPPAEAVYPAVDFEFAWGAGQVFGYFVTAGSTLLWPERFRDGPYNVRRGATRITVAPRVVLSQEDRVGE